MPSGGLRKTLLIYLRAGEGELREIRRVLKMYSPQMADALAVQSSESIYYVYTMEMIKSIDAINRFIAERQSQTMPWNSIFLGHHSAAFMWCDWIIESLVPLGCRRQKQQAIIQGPSKELLVWVSAFNAQEATFFVA